VLAYIIAMWLLRYSRTDGKIMPGGYYGVLGGCQGVAMLFLGCCELLSKVYAVDKLYMRLLGCLQMGGKVMPNGCYGILSGCQGVAMLFLGCCEL